MSIDELSPLLHQAQHRSIFSLWVADASLRVVGFTGEEGISRLFEFTIDVASEAEDIESLIGQPARLKIQGSEAPRWVHGIVRAAACVGYTRSFELYRLTIGPLAHVLEHRAGLRIFQDKTTPQIVTEVLLAARIPREGFRFSLAESYAPRNYCVQYRETDLAFVSRLLEEDGIFYFFEHEAAGHVWVIADHPRAHPPIAGKPALVFRPAHGALVEDSEHVHEFSFGASIRPGKVMLRDVNLHKPDQKLEVSESSKLRPELEVYDYPGEYQDPGRSGPHQGQTLAKIRLEALQAMRRAGQGESDCPRLVAGCVMELIGHPRAEFNERYRLTRVRHHGAQPQVLDQDAAGESSYRNWFECNESSVPFRPPRVTPRPVVHGLQTATVVGPESEEVHTDEHGRVRVQFHWDREGAHDGTSACWIRVSQVWAGNGWGALFLPRIGHEVLVDFIEGDPDRPVITGRIYHGLHQTPYALPDQKTQSGIKTDSSPGGGGSNELRFEDAKGGEEVYLHAQRNLTEKVENDHSSSVGVNHSNTVGANQSNTVGANQANSVGGNQTNSVGGNQTNSVSGNQTESVGANQTMSVGGSRNVSVTGSESVAIQSGASLTVTGDYKVDATNTISVQAPTQIKLTCGGSTITVEPGKITLSAGGQAKLVLDVDALLKSAAPSEVKLDADALIRASSGAKVQLDADVLAQAKKGSKVRLDQAAVMTGTDTAKVEGPIATLSGEGGIVEAAAAGVTCAGGQVNVSGGMVNVSGGMVKIN